jgi:phage terminase Nu1 subunit (DNA packaging protein)
MSLESIHWYAEKTRKARETIVKRLKASGITMTPGPKQATLYETSEALPVIYEAAEGGEQGELMRARTQNLEADTRLKGLREAQLRNELAPIDALTWALSATCSQIAAILETIPAKLKRALPNLTATDLNIIRKEIAKAQNAAAAARLDLPAATGEPESSDCEGDTNP